MSGGGSSGGGGSGAVSYPAYMQTFHGYLLDGGGVDTLTNSITDAINAAYGNSPFADASAYNPSVELNNMTTAVANFSSAVGALSNNTDMDTALTAAIAKIVTNMGTARSSSLTAAGNAYSTLYASVLAKVQLALADMEAEIYTSVKGRIDALQTTGLSTANANLTSIMASLTTALNTAFDAVIANVAAEVDEHITTASYISNTATTYGATLTSEIAANGLPLFQGGMRDINAVQSSAWVIGAALIEEGRVNKVAEFTANLTLQVNRDRTQIIQAGIDRMMSDLSSLSAVTQQAVSEYVTRNAALLAAELTDVLQLYHVDMAAAVGSYDKDLAGTMLHATDSAKTSFQGLLGKTEFQRALAALSIEKERMSILANQEEDKEQLEIDENDARWDLSVFQYGMNSLAGIGGGTVATAPQKRNTVGNALAGGLSGAAAGAAIGAQMGSAGGPYGAAIGAVVGIGASLMM